MFATGVCSLFFLDLYLEQEKPSISIWCSRIIFFLARLIWNICLRCRFKSEAFWVSKAQFAFLAILILRFLISAFAIDGSRKAHDFAIDPKCESQREPYCKKVSKNDERLIGRLKYIVYKKKLWSKNRVFLKIL